MPKIIHFANRKVEITSGNFWWSRSWGVISSMKTAVENRVKDLFQSTFWLSARFRNYVCLHAKLTIIRWDYSRTHLHIIFYQSHSGVSRLRNVTPPAFSISGDKFCFLKPPIPVIFNYAPAETNFYLFWLEDRRDTFSLSTFGSRASLKYGARGNLEI